MIILEKLNQEYDEVLLKYEKLEVFISSEDFGELEKLQKSLLKRQLNVLGSYLNILASRIKLLEKEQ